MGFFGLFKKRMTRKQRMQALLMCVQVELYIRDRQAVEGWNAVPTDTISTRKRLEVVWRGSGGGWENYRDMMDEDFHRWRDPLVGERLVRRIKNLCEEVEFNSWTQ